MMMGGWEGGVFFFNDTATTEIYTLSLHDALPIFAGSYRGATEDLRVTERFTRVGPETLEWEVTFEDPATWTSPWTMMIVLERSDDAIFEYACHEGNYGIEGILAGARAEEKTAQVPSP